MGVYRRRYRGKKGRIWWINYVVGGRQKRESSGSKSRRVAEKILALKKTQALEGRLGLPKSHVPRLGDWVKRFLALISHAKTKSRYQSSINNILRHFGRNVRLSEITPEMIFEFQQKRIEEGIAKATVNRDIATLSSALTRARKLRLITHNPCVDVGKLNERRERRQAKPLTYEEEARVKQASPPWLSTLITVLAETGLRVRKEALPLKWSDVDLDSEPGCIFVRDSKTAAGVRAVWLTKHCRNTLIQWREFLGLGFSQYVFPSPRIPSTHLSDYKRAWRRAAREAGIPDRRPYDLRASFASRANACRASGLTIAQLLGHATNTQILPTYVKPLDENTKAVIDALDTARASRPRIPPSVQ
jgi:integrase